MQRALGIIETRGLAAAIEAADVMLKTAAVKLLGRQKVKGGRTAVMVAGDVGAVKAATDAGTEACRRMGAQVSAHVIPRPHDDIDGMLLRGPAGEKAPAPGKGNAPKKRGRRRAKKASP